MACADRVRGRRDDVRLRRRVEYARRRRLRFLLLRFARGRVALIDPLAAQLPGATPAMFAPTGFVPSPVAPYAAVPICGPGLSLMMAALAIVGGRGSVFLLVPAFAALLVWLTFAFGRQLDDGATGAASAILVASSPIFLYQAVQPMSDVPAAALWLAALVSLGSGAPPSGNPDRARVGEILGGVCASLAVLTRPNLAIAVIPLLALLRTPRSWIRFALAALPGVAVLAWLNAVRYGSPLASGYGDAGALFSAAHVMPNLRRYPRWLLETQTPFIGLAALAPWWARSDRWRFRLTVVAGTSAALMTVTYLAYAVFDEWWYIRFLLPALPVVVVFSVAVFLRAAAWVFPHGGRSLFAIGITIPLALWYVQVGRSRHVFDLQPLEARFVLAARYAVEHLPPRAVFLAVQQSGSLRFHAGKPTLAWDGIPSNALDGTIAALAAEGIPVFFALEDAEEPGFRSRFAGQTCGGLDWPPLAEIHAAVRVRFYDVRVCQTTWRR
jgi:hypothetical protein